MFYERISVTTEIDADFDNEECSPYVALWTEVLLQAINDFRGDNTELRRQAVLWMFVSKDTTPGSFTWICLALGKDPNVLRERISPGWRQNATYKPPEPQKHEPPKRVRKKIPDLEYHIPKLGEKL